MPRADSEIRQDTSDLPVAQNALWGKAYQWSPQVRCEGISTSWS